VKEELIVKNVLDSDAMKIEIIPRISAFFARKSEFWLNITYSSTLLMEEFSKQIQILSKEARNLQDFIKRNFRN